MKQSWDARWLSGPLACGFWSRAWRRPPAYQEYGPADELASSELPQAGCAAQVRYHETRLEDGPRAGQASRAIQLSSLARRPTIGSPGLGSLPDSLQRSPTHLQGTIDDIE